MFAHFGLHKLRLKLALSVTLVALFYNEWLSHTIMKLDWVLPSSSGDGSIRMLLVADPQILGYRFEPEGIIGYVRRWDADRYLRNSFASALSYVNPDVVLFLGDHMDEGSIASDADFSKYKLRFISLFSIAENIKVISVPGDNDIGGEGGDVVTEEKVHRFDDAFGNETWIQHRFLEFVKVNVLTRTGSYETVPKKREDRFRIILSHIPLLTVQDTFAEKVLSTLKPDIIISAHEHRARLMEGSQGTVRLQSIDSMEQKGRVWNINFRGKILYEIMVPTCSYRMGVRKVGYGAAVLRPGGQLEYTVLWLPDRFLQLFVYLGALVFVLLLFSPCFFYRLWIQAVVYLTTSGVRLSRR